ncbi:hypothetical protein WA026_006998 [Henosepilachna vigintioctopunctata]|uniref:Uncharacterized protein n=1 Tax=Henosepilachna vigintioctopunctata TaxID=420089 RepID=A0AAW1V2X6_9CUCU
MNRKELKNILLDPVTDIDKISARGGDIDSYINQKQSLIKSSEHFGSLKSFLKGSKVQSLEEGAGETAIAGPEAGMTKVGVSLENTFQMRLDQNRTPRHKEKASE